MTDKEAILFIYLTPLIPLSFKREGEEKKEGLTPLLDASKSRIGY
jgi:hypothetical protein